MVTGEPISKVRINFNFKNVQTMRLNSDLKALTDEITNTNMMILGICETKRNKEETFVLDDLYHCYMGKADKRIGGMGFIIRKEFAKYIKFVEFQEARLGKILFKIGRKTILYTIGYAPTSQYTLDERESFFDKLLQFTKTPADFKIVAGDLNCKLQGIDKTKYGSKYYELKYEDKSENDLVNKFSAISGFNIVNTKFVERRNRRWTWCSPNKKTFQEIDYFLVSNLKHVINFNVLNWKVFNVRSDHRCIEIGVLVENIRNKFKKKKPCNVHILKGGYDSDHSFLDFNSKTSIETDYENKLLEERRALKNNLINTAIINKALRLSIDKDLDLYKLQKLTVLKNCSRKRLLKSGLFKKNRISIDNDTIKQFYTSLYAKKLNLRRTVRNTNELQPILKEEISEAGVKQGDALSPTLFCIALNRALRKANLERFGERYGNTCIPYLGFAEDLVLIAPSIHKAQKMLEELTYQTSQLGMKINQKKTQFMARIVKRKWVKGRGGKRVKKLEFTEDPVIKLNGEMLEKVEIYRYLGQIVSIKLKDYNSNELRERIKKETITVMN
uniref:Reverse transcriptase domain-containing protein n=1 Tax=Strongyloides papillosus TaxID=174720 RepID=A0A0N5B5F1_STREA